MASGLNVGFRVHEPRLGHFTSLRPPNAYWIVNCSIKAYRRQLPEFCRILAACSLIRKIDVLYLVL